MSDFDEHENLLRDLNGLRASGTPQRQETSNSARDIVTPTRRAQLPHISLRTAAIFGLTQHRKRATTRLENLSKGQVVRGEYTMVCIVSAHMSCNFQVINTFQHSKHEDGVYKPMINSTVDLAFSHHNFTVWTLLFDLFGSNDVSARHDCNMSASE